MFGIIHCWKILLILVLGKVASKTQYSHFVICKVWVLGFTHHFTLHPLIWQIFSLISWLYFSTMWILWGRKCDYWVFHITHAKKGLPNHSSSTRDLKDFFSICDVENTILTYPPHSILSLLKTTKVATLWNNLSCKLKVMAQFLYILYITVNVVTCAKQKSMYSHVSTLTFDQHQFHKFFCLVKLLICKSQCSHMWVHWPKCLKI